jgi:Flp pilus assembly protein TadG
MDKGMHHKGRWHRVSSGRVRGPASQRGAVLALVTVGMLAIIGMAGLALQSGHLFVNKTHLQNALDAAALSAAKTLNNDGTVATATAAGIAAFESHRAPATGGEPTFLERELRDSSYTLTFSFSATLDPFTPGATETDDPPATFVRASATDFTMDTWLANVLPGVGDEQDIGGTAVAGPLPIDPNNTCDIAPLVMCALDPDPADTDARDCSDGDCYGFNPGPNEEIVLYDDQHGAVGPGNFQLLRLGDSHGADDIREQLAGGYSGCASVGEHLDTQPGADLGPVIQGFNTRFGTYAGGLSSSDGAPDTVTYHEPGSNPDGDNIGTCTFCYDDYTARQDGEQYNYEPQPNGIGVPERRVLAVTIGRCPAEPNPTVEVLGIGCFFMSRPVDNPPGPVKAEIYGQLIRDCQVDGSVATAPPSGGTLLYKIVLFKDPDSRDS